jgi:predicted transcriptional regulator
MRIDELAVYPYLGVAVFSYVLSNVLVRRRSASGGGGGQHGVHCNGNAK